MPEIPDLEAIAWFLRERLPDRSVAAIETRFPWLVRTGAAELDGLVGHRFVDARRHGKYLLLPTDDERLLVVNPMLTGRFQWAQAGERRRPMTAVVVRFADGAELRYSDQRKMGRWYLVPVSDLGAVPQFAQMGPDALAVGEAEFVERLRRRRGQLKHTLTNQEFICGIGNAYSDEVLWEAGLHPHRTGATLDDDERRALYAAMHRVFAWAIPILRAEVADGLWQRQAEWRDHLRVHRKAGEPCPRCGEPVRAQVRSGRETNYCVRCQPLLEARSAGPHGAPPGAEPT